MRNWCAWRPALAERYFPHDPNTSLLKLGQLAEVLAQAGCVANRAVRSQRYTHLSPSDLGAPPRALRDVEILGLGGGLHWEALDLDLSVPALVASIFEGSTWMAELGRAGGRRSSAAKASAARKNGQKGGRPRTRSTLRA